VTQRVSGWSDHKPRHRAAPDPAAHALVESFKQGRTITVQIVQARCVLCSHPMRATSWAPPNLSHNWLPGPPTQRPSTLESWASAGTGGGGSDSDRGSKGGGVAWDAGRAAGARGGAQGPAATRAGPAEGQGLGPAVDGGQGEQGPCAPPLWESVRERVINRRLLQHGASGSVCWFRSV
jgi:hypothetical protein